MEILGIELGFDAPEFSTSGVGFWITVIAVVIFFLVLMGILVWFYIQHKRFNIKIRDFENISGQGYQLVKRDTARIVKIGDGGEELLLLRKGKTFRTAYGRKMGKNEYWFSKGQDGYWYNSVLGDLDAKMGMLDIEPIDRDMRYMHVAIRKNIQDRYRKKEGLEKYAPLIISFFFIVIMIIAVWLLMAKAGDLIASATGSVNAAQPIAEQLTIAVSKLDTLCAGGSGLK